MKIRSITSFLHPHQPVSTKRLERAGRLVAQARQALQAAGYEVQTVRLATVPFQELLLSTGKEKLPELAGRLEREVQALGFDYVSLGPAMPGELDSYRLIPDAIAATQNAFFSGVVADATAGVSLPAVRACAQVIHRAAGLDPDGFSNLRFAALANVPPGTPFFPAAYHAGDAPAFALATEAADLAVDAFSGAASLKDARKRLQESLERHGAVLASVCTDLARQDEVHFGGIDFSLAPFLRRRAPWGAAMERLGAPAVGLHGSLAAAALLAETLDRAELPHAGFSGLMLPVLEDAVLAARAAQGLLTLKDLLLYSAVCGTGLDTVPLPGDTSPEAISAVLLDLAVLSERLKKPLTARLMPIPGKVAGDPTHFEFAYFANSRVLPLDAAPLRFFFGGSEESISLIRRA